MPIDSPDRFVVEVLFSNGANFDPTAVVPVANDHTLPAVPRAPLHTGIGVPLARLVSLLEPCAAPRKAAPSTYALQVLLGGCCGSLAPVVLGFGLGLWGRDRWGAHTALGARSLCR